MLARPAPSFSELGVESVNPLDAVALNLTTSLPVADGCGVIVRTSYVALLPGEITGLAVETDSENPNED